MNFYKHGGLLAAVLLLLSACATPQQTRRLLTEPPDIPPRVELDHVPFYPQRDYQCGPAALATVINHYQRLTSPEQLLPLVYIPALKGTLQVELSSAVRRFSMMALEMDGSLLSVLREVAAGHPVLVMQNLGLDLYPFWHYAVVIGYDLSQQQIILRSGEVERLVRPFSVFERTWARAGYWALLVLPPAEMGPTIAQAEYIKAAVALESSSSIEASRLAYDKGIQRWPESYILQMGRGNVAYVEGEYELAEQHFNEAIRIRPESAEAWNNLAYTHLKQQRQQAALDAIEKAIRLDPQNDQYQDSLNEISSMLKN